MTKSILLIGYNFSPEPTGIGKYSGEMIEWLCNKGYECTVLTTYPYYPFWKVQEPYFDKRFFYTTEDQFLKSGGKIKIHRCPIYVPKNPTGMERMLLDFSFLVSALIKIIQLIPLKKFDFVITVVPSFQFGILGVLYKTFRKTKFLYHIQDLQIEAAQDLNLIKSKLLIRSMLTVEKFILKKADYISTISKGMVSKVKKKSSKEIYLLENWVDTSFFKPIDKNESLKIEFGFNSKDKVVLYSGAMGEKQGLEMILQSANSLREDPNLKFLLCGSGPYSIKLKSMAKELGLTNVVFLPLQPMDRFNEILNMADLHLIIQKSQTSNLVMPSKLTTILAVGGLALVTANKNTDLFDLIENNEIAILIDSDNQEQLTEGIKKAINGNWKCITTKAREYAEWHLSIDNILNSYEKQILTGTLAN